MKIYTKTGDAGETSLLSGGRVAKTDARVEAYGTLDELNSVIGLLRTEPLPRTLDQHLAVIQGVLFELGAALADPQNRSQRPPSAWDAEPLERWIDAMDGDLPALKAFILPGGRRSAALAHLARTVCRRAERRVLEIGAGIPEGVVPYLNRLSDTLFVLARFLNARLGVADPLWRPQERAG